MERVNCNKIIFSSSATVYQPAESLSDLPLSERSPTGKTTNPYARSKLHVEEILNDASIADSNLSVVNLRYFNPVGAHSSGLIGEDPRGIPNNLMPYISQVAVGRRPHLNVFGNDYPTADGTGEEKHSRKISYLFDFLLNILKAQIGIVPSRLEN